MLGAMAATIDVRCEAAGDGWACRVTVTEDGSSTTHQVMVARAVLGRLAPGASEPSDLVLRSFVFLLAREPKESILARFDLPLIGRYFPDYERMIRPG